VTGRRKDKGQKEEPMQVDGKRGKAADLKKDKNQHTERRN